MPYKIFLSHAVADKELVEFFIDYLETGLGISSSEVYCTSVLSTIPTGQSFIENIKQNIHGTDRVILLITESFLESNFCLCEMGASWAINQNIYPIIVPPLTYSSLNSTPLMGLNAIMINDDAGLVKMADEFKGYGIVNNLNLLRFNSKRKQFLDGLQSHYTEIAQQTVPIEKYHQMEQAANEILNENERKDQEIEELKQLIETIKKAKDKDEVVSIELEQSSEPEKLDFFISELMKSIEPLGRLLTSSIYNEYRGVEFYPGTDYRQELNELEADGKIEFTNKGFTPNRDDFDVRNAYDKLYQLEKYIEDECPADLYDQFEKNSRGVKLDLKLRPFWKQILDVSIILSVS